MARLVLLLAPLALLAAGCVSPGTTVDPNAQTALGAPGATLNDTAALVYTVGDALSGRAIPGVQAVSRYVGHDAAEPTVAITSDGTLFYAAITFSNDVAGQEFPLPRTDILRSTDGGLTWEDVTPFLPGGVVRSHFDTGDPYVYVDPATDRVYDLDQRFAVGQYSISYSDDKGATWSGPFFLCDAPPCDHQTMTTFAPPLLPASPIYPNQAMACWNQIHSVACKVSPDGGATWVRAASPFAGVEGAELCGGLHGHIVSGPAGEVYLPKEHCGAPMIAVTKDGGLTWETTQVSDVGASGPDPVVAVDKEGNVYYVYLDEAGRLMYSVSTDQGATWTQAIDVTPPGLTATHLPAIAAGAAGRVVLAYVATDDPEGYEQDLDPEEANALWHGYLSVIEDGLAPAPTVTTARVNPIDDPLVRGQCGPGRCPALYDFIDVIVDADGRPWAAFSDACVEECVTDGADGNNALEGFVATLETGPSLLAPEQLPPIHAAGEHEHG